LKKELATLDVVVTAVEYGHGRRREVLSDYTFAVRDGESGMLLTIGKAYSGLTDKEIAELTPWFLERVRGVKGRLHEVEPELVIEVAFDSIRPSARHPSGLALRFPRIKGLRRDKSVAEIDTLQFAETLLCSRIGSAPESRAGLQLGEAPCPLTSPASKSFSGLV
jgi:DNA ligase-1